MHASSRQSRASGIGLKLHRGFARIAVFRYDEKEISASALPVRGARREHAMGREL